MPRFGDAYAARKCQRTVPLLDHATGADADEQVICRQEQVPDTPRSPLTVWRRHDSIFSTLFRFITCSGFGRIPLAADAWYRRFSSRFGPRAGPRTHPIEQPVCHKPVPPSRCRGVDEKMLAAARAVVGA